jgi:hypothetical protein
MYLTTCVIFKASPISEHAMKNVQAARFATSQKLNEKKLQRQT